MNKIIISMFLSMSPTPIHYCDIPPSLREVMGLPPGECLPAVKAPSSGPQALSWCCNFDGSPCVLVSSLSNCDPNIEYLVSCDWGQTNLDGTITCYG